MQLSLIEIAGASIRRSKPVNAGSGAVHASVQPTICRNCVVRIAQGAALKIFAVSAGSK
jgi:hypothetical protein